MREIKFKAKRIDNGEWVEGFYIHRISHKIADTNGIGLHEVHPETVCQYTGLNATKGKVKLIGSEIYEWDIFRSAPDEDGKENYLVVMWIPQRAAFYMIPVVHYLVLSSNDCSEEPEFDWLFSDAALYDFSLDCGLTKVGNRFDNPELIK